MFVLALLLNFIYHLLTVFVGIILFILLSFRVVTFFTKTRCESKAKLEGKVALITGGNAGIGYETAKDLAARGATVIIASRDEAKSSQAVDKIIKQTGNRNVQHRYLDLAQFRSVRTFAADFNKSFERLDILVNNAGCVGLKNRLTSDGISVVMQVNYFGPFLLTNLLRDKLIASTSSRIVIVTSIAHLVAQLDLEDLKGLNEYHFYTTYATSKLCNILWAKALAKNLPKGVTANAAHPGIVQTEIYNIFYPGFREIALFFIGTVFKTPEEGAQTIIHLAVSEEVEGKTGGYYTECARTTSTESDIARDEELMDKVWAKSLQMTSA